MVHDDLTVFGDLESGEVDVAAQEIQATIGVRSVGDTYVGDDTQFETPAPESSCQDGSLSEAPRLDGIAGEGSEAAAVSLGSPGARDSQYRGQSWGLGRSAQVRRAALGIALILGAILAIVVHLVRTPRPAQAASAPGHQLPQAPAGHAPLPPAPSSDRGPSSTEPEAVGFVDPVRERHAAVQLMSFECPKALETYRALAGESHAQPFELAVRLLFARCPDGPQETEARLPAAPPGTSSLQVAVRRPDGWPVSGATLKVLRAGRLLSVHVVEGSENLQLPSQVGDLSLELVCPVAHRAEVARRRLPPVLPPSLEMSLVCRPEKVSRLVAVLVSGPPGVEVRVTSGTLELGQTRGGVLHAALELDPSQPIPLLVSPVSERFLVPRGEHVLVPSDVDRFDVVSFEARARPRPQGPLRRAPKNRPYRL